MIPSYRYKLRSLTCLAIGLFTTIAAVAADRVHRLTSDEESLFKIVLSNAEQERSTMTLDPILCLVARQRAADMARRNYFGHINPDGHGANFLISREGYLLPASYDASRSGNNIESLGMSTGRPREILSLWLGSSAHRLHVMGELDFFQQQTSAGVGIARSPRPPYYKYYVFLSAPPNASLALRTIVLKSPKGKTIASTKKFAAAWASVTGTAAP